MAVLPLPDPGIHFVGLEDPQRGARQVEVLERFGLQPGTHLLEIGCGVGRLPYALSTVLGPNGRYAGFDVSPDAIAWLNENYAPKLPRFRFDHLDVHNPRFHPTGHVQPADVRFPYEDQSFDMVCAFEVFMHMERDGMAAYLREIARVLRPRSRAIATFMAIYNPTDPGRHAGRSFVQLGDGVYTRFPDRVGWSMGYDHLLILRTVADANLRFDENIEGNWHYPCVDRGPGLYWGCDLYVLSRPYADAASDANVL